MARKRRFKNPWDHRDSIWYNEEKEKWYGGDALETNLDDSSPSYLEKGKKGINVLLLDENYEKLNTLDPKIAKVFQMEYGLKVSYHSALGKLQLEEDLGKPINGSETARNSFKKLLEKNTKQRIIFGKKLKVNGKLVFLGMAIPSKNDCLIDLDDFKDDLSIDGATYKNGLDPRAYNMARFLEHEFFGHLVLKFDDGLESVNIGEAGPTVKWVNENVREELNLPYRLNYASDNLKIFFAPSEIANDPQAMEKLKNDPDLTKTIPYVVVPIPFE